MAIIVRDIPLWEKWGTEQLERKRDSVGEREFARGWRQRALAEDETLFRKEHIDAALDPERRLYWPGSDKREDVCPKSYSVYFGVDLSIAGKKSAGDYFTIFVIAVDKNRFQRYIVGIYHNRGLTFNEQIRKVEEWNDFFKPKSIFVENNAYQDAFIQELSRRSGDELPVTAFTTNAVNKIDIEEGLPRVSIEFEKERWVIPMAPGPTRQLTDILVGEMSTYPVGKHDDMVMAMWFARQAAVYKEDKVEARIYVV
jgi:phage terminase large subunit-like protein